LKYYFETFGRNPTTVFINTILWDLQGECQHAFKAENYRENLLILISVVRKTIGDKANVGFRTCPVGADNLVKANACNKIIRSMYKEGHVSVLYDYDKNVWSTLDFVAHQDNNILLFGGPLEHHPGRYFILTTAEKMLRNSYSSYYVTHQSNVSIDSLAAINNPDFTINYMRSESNRNEMYYTKFVGNIRYKWKVNSSEFSLGQWMHVSKGDFLTVPLPILDSFPTLEMPPFFIGNFFFFLRGIITKNQRMFLIYWSEFFVVYHVPNNSTFSIFKVEQSKIDDTFMKVEEMEDFYSEGTLIRLHSSKQVYVVSNMTKKSVSGMAVLYAHGLDLENVKVARHSLFLDIIPDGGEFV
jgi:hypothetical protein